MKKFLSIILVLVIATFTLIGCKKDSVNNKLTVTIWDKGQEKGIKSILEDFTKETGIETDLQVVTWDSYWTLLEAGASGGDMPDVFWMHPNQAQKYMSNDILLDLTDMINNSQVLDLSKFKQDIVEVYKYDNKIYGIPKDVDTIALWYNKTMFDEAGISYPDESWTWDTYYEVAKNLTKEDGSQYGLAMNPTNDQDSYYNIIYSMGGSVLSKDKTKSEFNNENTIKALSFIQKLVNETMPPINVMAETGIDTLLSSGKVAMITQGSWMLPAFKENEYILNNCDVAIIPKDVSGKRVSMYNGLGWSVSANTKNKDSALKLVEWFGREDMQRKQADLGVTMSAYEGTSENWVKSSNFNLNAYLDVLDKQNAILEIKPYSKETLAWEKVMHENLKLLWDNSKTPEEVGNNIANKMNEILANE